MQQMRPSRRQRAAGLDAATWRCRNDDTDPKTLSASFARWCGRVAGSHGDMLPLSLRSESPLCTQRRWRPAILRVDKLRMGVHLPKNLLLLLSAPMLTALIAAEASPVHKVPWPTQHGVKEALQRRGLIDQNQILTQKGIAALK